MKVGDLVRNKGHLKRGEKNIIGIVLESCDKLQIATVRWPTRWCPAFLYKWAILETLSEAQQ